MNTELSNKYNEAISKGHELITFNNELITIEYAELLLDKMTKNGQQ